MPPAKKDLFTGQDFQLQDFVPKFGSQMVHQQGFQRGNGPPMPKEPSSVQVSLNKAQKFLRGSE